MTVWSKNWALLCSRCSHGLLTVPNLSSTSRLKTISLTGQSSCCFVKAWTRTSFWKWWPRWPFWPPSSWPALLEVSLGQYVYVQWSPCVRDALDLSIWTLPAIVDQNEGSPSLVITVSHLLIDRPTWIFSVHICVIIVILESHCYSPCLSFELYRTGWFERAHWTWNSSDAVLFRVVLIVLLLGSGL